MIYLTENHSIIIIMMHLYNIPQAQDSGLGESVCTLYEIHSGEDNESQG